MAGGIILWVVDNMLRFHHGTTAVTVRKMVGHEEHTELVVQVRKAPVSSEFGPLQHGTGQYYFVNVPALSIMEWHPFSVASSPLDNTSSFHIKKMGPPDSFTSRLHQLAKGVSAAQEAQRLRLGEGIPPVIPIINMDGRSWMHCSAACCASILKSHSLPSSSA